MSWGVAVCTWNDPERCRATVSALRVGLVGDCRLVVVDNGSRPAFTMDGVAIVRYDDNAGAGGGLTRAVRAVVDDPTMTHVLFVEDDWTLERDLDLVALESILADQKIGQVRLAARPDRPPRSWWTHGLEGIAADEAAWQVNAPRIMYAGVAYQRVKLLWSSNPFAVRRDVADRFLLDGRHELAIARPYAASGLWTASTVPGYFRHEGTVRDRRGQPGWRR